jgi:hypothetical protein
MRTINPCDPLLSPLEAEDSVHAVAAIGQQAGDLPCNGPYITKPEDLAAAMHGPGAVSGAVRVPRGEEGNDAAFHWTWSSSFGGYW